MKHSTEVAELNVSGRSKKMGITHAYRRTVESTNNCILPIARESITMIIPQNITLRVELLRQGGSIHPPGSRFCYFQHPVLFPAFPPDLLGFSNVYRYTYCSNNPTPSHTSHQRHRRPKPPPHNSRKSQRINQALLKEISLETKPVPR